MSRTTSEQDCLHGHMNNIDDDDDDDDDDDIYIFQHFKLFTGFESTKNIYNDYNQTEVARASRIGLRPSGLRQKKKEKNMTSQNTK